MMTVHPAEASHGYVFGIAMFAAALVAAPAPSLGAKSTKPKEIVVVGSKLKKKGSGQLRPGDTLMHRWQRSSGSGKKLKSK
jgi:hypothetical protein